MTEKMLARVAVSSVPYAADRLYTYLVPDELIGSAEVGKRVTIPFGRGNRRVEGFLLEVGREAATSPLKPIDALLDDAPLLDAKDIRLVRWMKARYFCTYYDAIKTILPGGVWLQYRELWHVNGEISAEDALSSVAPDSLEETLLRAMLSAKKIERGALDELGGEKTAKALRSLEACGLAVRETKLRQRLQDKSVRMVSLCVSAEDALAAVEPKRRSAPVRYAVVELLSREGCLSSSEISYYTGATMQTLRGLKKAGLVEFSEREVLRVSRYDDAPAREDIVLNGEQQAQIVEDRAAGLAQVGSDDVTATPTARVDPITNAQEECCSRQTRNGQHKSATKALDICFHSNLPLRIRAALSSATIPVRVPSHHWIGRSRVCQQRRFNEQWYVTFTI